MKNFGRRSKVDNYDKRRNVSKKERKYHSKIIKRGVHCQFCYNEGHLTKECKLLNKFSHICKQNDHYLSMSQQNNV